MKSDNFYLLTFLSGLDRLDTAPDISPAEFMDSLQEGSATIKAVREIFLAEDLTQREAFLAGEIESVEPLVLTAEMCKDDQPLPDELLEDSSDSTRKVAADIVWESYFKHAAGVAAQTGSSFLKSYIGFEVFLRNALVEVRAEALGLEPSDYYVARDLEQDCADLSNVINEWSAAVAENPLKGQRVLDRFRWDWIQDNSKYFSFADDEIVAYAAKLILATRWKRLIEATENV